MLRYLPDGRIYDGNATPQGAETQAQANARELKRLVQQIRDESPDPQLRILADALLTLAKAVLG